MNAGPLDLVRAEIMKRVGPEIDARFEQLIPIFTKAMKREEPLDSIDIPPATDPVPAGTAAKRTTIQGFVAVILATVFGFVADAVSNEDFQVFDLGDWKGVGTGAIVAGLMALLAFGQRKIGR